MKLSKPWKQYEKKWFMWHDHSTDLYFKYIKYNSYDAEAIYWGWSERMRMFKYLYFYPPTGKLKPYTPTHKQLRKVIIDAFKSEHDW